jgi:hypothetical protein
MFIFISVSFKFRRNTPTNTCIRLVTTLILPHIFIDYCDIVYCDVNAEMESKLEKLVNACIRYVYNLKKYDHVSQYYNVLKWYRIGVFGDFYVLCYMYKIILTDIPSYLFKKHVYSYEISSF